MILIHYGSSGFDITKFETPRSTHFGSRTKPYGGIWFSPLKSTQGWKYFVETKLKAMWLLKPYFLATLIAPEERVLKIKNPKDIDILPKKVRKADNRIVLDYDKICKSYDAIWLTKQGLKNTASGLRLNTWDWDCESIVVLNPYAIKPEK
jgi:hypothetical protein